MQAAMNFGQFSQANGATGAQAAAINTARARAMQGINDFMADNVITLNINPNNVGRVQQDLNQLERISAWGEDQLSWYNWLHLFIERWTASGISPLQNLLMDNAKHALKLIQDIIWGSIIFFAVVLIFSFLAKSMKFEFKKTFPLVFIVSFALGIIGYFK